MATVPVGVLITAKDQATAVIRGVGRSVELFGNTYAKAVASVFFSVEIFKKVAGLFRDVFGGFLEHGLAVRAEADQQRRDWEQYGKTLTRLAGVVGDILIPIILGIGDAFQPAIRGATNYLIRNKEIVGAGLVEHLATVARLLLSSVVPAAIYTARAFAGISEIWGLLKSAAFKFLEGFERALAGMLLGIEKINRVLGRDGMADAAAETRKHLEGLADGFGQASSDAYDEVVRTVAQLDLLEAQAKAVGEAIDKGIGVAALAAIQRLKQGVINLGEATGLSVDAAKRKLDEWVRKGEQAVASLRESQQDYQISLDRMRDRDFRSAVAAEQKKVDAAKEAHSLLEAGARTAAQSVVGFFTSAFDALREGGIAAFGKMLARWATQLAASAVLGLLTSLFSGGAIGAGAGIAKGVLGGLGSIFGFNAGGIVHANAGLIVGGPPVNRDVVPALLTPGERVLTRRETRDLDRGIPPTRSDGSPVAAGGGGQTLVVQTFGLPTQADMDRWHRDVVEPAQRRAMRRSRR